MKELAEKSYNRFDLFRNQWAVVTAGTIDNFNGCTVSWGSMGTLWTRGGETGNVITVYIHPGRYTCGFMENSDTFTVSFFPNEYRKALGYVGTHSGRDEDKFSAAGLTPVEIGGSVGYKEASVTFVCKKMYGAPFDKAGLNEEIARYYKANPKAYPVDENGDWQPHLMFVGEVVAVEEK